MFGKRIVTLNIEGDNLRLLTAKGKHIQKWAFVPLSPGLVRDGLVRDPQALGLAIKALLAQERIHGDQVVSSLTGLQSVMRILSMPRMKNALLQEALQWESRRQISVPLEELYLSWQVLAAVDGHQQVLVLGVPRNLLDTHVQALEQARIAPYTLELKPMALARAVNRKEAVIIDLESATTDIILVVDFVPVIIRTLVSPQGEISLEDRMERLATELSRTAKFYNSTHTEAPFKADTPAFLTGELADDPAVVSLVRGAIGYSVEPLTPPMQCPPDLPVSQYSVNIGLALKAMSPKASPKGRPASTVVNLDMLPERYKPRPLPVANIVLHAGVILATAMLVLSYQARSFQTAQADSLQSRLSLTNGKLEQLRATTDATRAKITSIEKLQKEYQTVIDSRNHLYDNAQSTVDALIAGVRLKTVSETPTQITLSGETDNYLAITQYATALENLGSWTTVRIDRMFRAETGEALSFVIVAEKKVEPKETKPPAKAANAPAQKSTAKTTNTPASQKTGK